MDNNELRLHALGLASKAHSYHEGGAPEKILETANKYIEFLSQGADQALSVADAMARLKEAIRTDSDYRLGWECNIAMAFKDVWTFNPYDPQHGVTPEHIHLVANKAAAVFLDLLIHTESNEADGMAALAQIHRDAKPMVGPDGKLTR